MIPGSAAHWLLECLEGHGRSDQVALSTRSGGAWESLSFGQLAQRSRVVAHQVAEATNPGDPVLLAVRPSGNWVVGFFGALLGGAVVVPVDVAATDWELRRRVELVQPRLSLVADPDIARRLQSASLQQIQITDPPPADEAHGELPPRSMNDVALYMTTAGTTGAPKAVALTLANVAYVTNTLAELQGADETDVWLSVLPLHHMLELACVLLPALRTGGHVMFADSIVSTELIGFMEEHGVTRMMTVPVLLQMLAARLKSKPRSLRSLYCGGAPLIPAVAHHLEELGIPVYAGYGLTETSPTISVNHPAAAKTGTVGQPLPDTEVAIDPETGEISVKGPGLMRGYLNGPAGVDEGGWFRTGDLGHLDDEGYLHVSGRIKNLIVLPSGRNVQPEEVEAALASGSRFAEVCVTGRSSVCVIVVPLDETLDQASAEQYVAEHCRDLSAYKRPTRVIVRREPLPKSVKKTADRAAVWELARNEGAT